MFDALATQAQITTLISQLGVTATITRQSARVFSGCAVFSNKAIQRTGDAEAQISLVVDASVIAYIPGTATAAPIPGDLFVTNAASYLVKSCSPYMPADIVIAYKLELE